MTRPTPPWLGRWHIGPVRGGPTAHRPTSGAIAVLGLLTVAWPAVWAPPWTYPVAGLGALAALAAAGLRWPRWRRGPVLAVTAAVITCAFSTAGAAVLAAAVADYLIALPARRPQTLPARRPQRSRSRDASSRPDSV
jgi:hypothetical protein